MPMKYYCNNFIKYSELHKCKFINLKGSVTVLDCYVSYVIFLLFKQEQHEKTSVYMFFKMFSCYSLKDCLKEAIKC